MDCGILIAFIEREVKVFSFCADMLTEGVIIIYSPAVCIRIAKCPEKGKLSERTGRKATGLNPLLEGTAAGLPDD